MFQLIRAIFNQRIKTLVNGLQNGGLGLTKDEILAALSEMGLSEMVRGETLSLEQFALLSDILQKNHNI
jgi:16S rRNA (adenine1518-N6/adenine1519-N6)-dimethyltransferase